MKTTTKTYSFPFNELRQIVFHGETKYCSQESREMFMKSLANEKSGIQLEKK